jgi:hypothetical protein
MCGSEESSLAPDFIPKRYYEFRRKMRTSRDSNLCQKLKMTDSTSFFSVFAWHQRSRMSIHFTALSKCSGGVSSDSGGCDDGGCGDGDGTAMAAVVTATAAVVAMATAMAAATAATTAVVVATKTTVSTAMAGGHRQQSAIRG